MAGSKQITRIPLFIKGKTPEDLSRKCLENNIKYQTEFLYFQIDKIGSDWFAWFNADITKYPMNNIIKKPDPIIKEAE